MIYATPSSRHLVKSIGMPHGSCTFKQFSDGEWHVAVHDEVRNRNVWVLAQTGAPTDNLIQLLLLCDALKQAGAHLNLLISYFGYARQDRPFKGEPLAAELMCKLLEVVEPKRSEVIHLHNPKIGRGVLSNHIPYKFFLGCREDAEVIVAPDRGAQGLARHIAQQTHKELVSLEKHRPAPEQVELSIHGEVSNKNVLIVDDMITTGRTVIQAAELLYKKGASSVRVAATHGVFTPGAIKNLEESSIERVYITNTLEQHSSSDKIVVKDISPYLADILINN